MRALNRITVVLMLILLGCGQQTGDESGEMGAASEPAAAADRAADIESVRARIDDFLVAWNAADTAALESLVAEDVVLLQPEGPVLEGRNAILGMIAGAYDTSQFQQSVVVDEVIMLGDYGYGRGVWSLEPTANAGADADAETGKWSHIYRRGPTGEWQLWRWMWNQPLGTVPSEAG
jgi:uncharacterized protein (TIGR02246 family)